MEESVRGENLEGKVGEKMGRLGASRGRAAVDMRTTARAPSGEPDPLQGRDEVRHQAISAQHRRDACPLRAAEGKFDIVGDVHGMAAPLFDLMSQAGWRIDPHDIDGTSPIGARHPDGRHLVFTGDLINKGPQSLTVLRLLLGMHQMGTASAVLGNHEDMLIEAIYHPADAPKKSVRKTFKALGRCDPQFRFAIMELIGNLPAQLDLPMPAGRRLSGDGTITVVHAGAKPEDLRGSGGRRRKVHGAGLSNSRKSGWTRAFDKGERWVIHGHTPSRGPRIGARVIGLDTGAGDGGALTMLRADTCGFLSVATALTS